MPSWLQTVLSTCPLATKFKGERLPIPTELRQLPYFQKRFRNKYAHLYKAHDERGLKCPMDVRTMEDIVSFCQHVLRSDDIIGPTKDQARVFLARVLNVYNAQNPVPGAMDEDIFDSAGNLKQKQPEAASDVGNSNRNANPEAMTEKPALPELRPEQAEELEAAAARLSSEQDRRRMRRLERHIVKLEARLTLLEPDSDGASSNSPVLGAAPKQSLDISREREKDKEKDRDLRDLSKGLGLGLGLGGGGLARAGSGAGTGGASGSGGHARTASGGLSGASNAVRVASSTGNGGHARTASGGNSPLARAGSGAGSNNSGATAKSNSAKDKDKDKDTSLRERDGEARDNKDVLKGDKDLREAKVLLREVPVIKRLPRSTPPQLRTPPPPPVRT